jgi:hypothetical protein
MDRSTRSRSAETRIAKVSGDAESAQSFLARAIEELDRVGMRLWAPAARRRRGELEPGVAGQELVTQADRWMAENKIKNPSYFTRMLCPP